MKLVDIIGSASTHEDAEDGSVEYKINLSVYTDGHVPYDCILDVMDACDIAIQDVFEHRGYEVEI